MSRNGTNEPAQWYERNAFRLFCEMKIRRFLKWSMAALLLGLVAWLQIAYWTSTNDCDQKAGFPSHPIKAIRYCEYGAPDAVLRLEQVEKPVPNDNQVLVRVRAVSLRFFDGGMLGGSVPGR